MVNGCYDIKNHARIRVRQSSGGGSSAERKERVRHEFQKLCRIRWQMGQPPKKGLVMFDRVRLKFLNFADVVGNVTLGMGN